MFRISRRLDYGLQLMIALAQEPENRPQATAQLAERLQIPLPFLHQIGRSLIQGRLIKATPGPHGGLRLNQPPTVITLQQIIEAMEGPICLSPGLGEDAQPADNCISSPVWEELQSRLLAHLGKVSLASMAAQPIVLPELIAVERKASNN